MALPTSRAELVEYILRRLGKPVINIEVDASQIDDRIDDALQMYRDYHFDATTKVYYKHQVTAEDKINKFIPVSEDIQGITRIFDVSGIANGSNMFDIRYQIALNDLYTLTQMSIVPFYMTMQHLELLNIVLNGSKPIRFERHMNRLHIDMDWNIIPEGTFIVAEAYQELDPDEFTDIWSDRWLMKYATALVKKQWGEHLKKFPMQLPGGVVLNGQQIYNEATDEIAEMEERVVHDYSYPLGYEMG